MKPYSESCDQNCQPILEIIEPLLKTRRSLLEIGSGTGQHAVYFAEKLPDLQWQTSDVAAHHEGIKLWIEDARLTNVLPPVELDTLNSPWPTQRYDAVFSANTTHIMNWPAVTALFEGVGSLLVKGGEFLLYGPFNYAGRYTSDSNARFDQWLKQRDPQSGIRDFEALQELAGRHGMQLQKDHEMPANNRLLQWQKN